MEIIVIEKFVFAALYSLKIDKVRVQMKNSKFIPVKNSVVHTAILNSSPTRLEFSQKVLTKKSLQPGLQ
jgi:hypothetical protein